MGSLIEDLLIVVRDLVALKINDVRHEYHSSINEGQRMKFEYARREWEKHLDVIVDHLSHIQEYNLSLDNSDRHINESVGGTD